MKTKPAKWFETKLAVWLIVPYIITQMSREFKHMEEWDFVCIA